MKSCETAKQSKLYSALLVVCGRVFYGCREFIYFYFFLKERLQLKWRKEVSGRVVIEMQKLEVEIGCKNENSTKL